MLYGRGPLPPLSPLPPLPLPPPSPAFLITHYIYRWLSFFPSLLTLTFRYGKATGEVMADACITLAHMWHSAWLEADAKANLACMLHPHPHPHPSSFLFFSDVSNSVLYMLDTGVVSNATLWNLYMTDTFLPSYTLDQISSHLTIPNSTSSSSHPPPTPHYHVPPLQQSNLLHGTSPSPR